jgi:DNA-binding NarL/FixJ family response regulator
MFDRLRAVTAPDLAWWRVASRDHTVTDHPDLLVIASSADVPLRRIEVIAAAHADVPVIVVTDLWSDLDERRALDAGASGYLALELPPAVLARALRAATRGEVVFRRRTLGLWLRPGSPMPERATRLPELTRRQQEVASLLTTGAADKEIAARLGIGVATVQKHVSKLLRTVGANNRAAAVWLVLGGARLGEPG